MTVALRRPVSLSAVWPVTAPVRLWVARNAEIPGNGGRARSAAGAAASISIAYCVALRAWPASDGGSDDSVQRGLSSRPPAVGPSQ
jgi:hypothetical protein